MIKRIIGTTLLVGLLTVSLSAVADETRDGIGQFSATGLKGWTSKSFSGDTDYQLVTDEEVQVLQAVSNDNASGMFFKQRIDLEQTPYLNWRWKISSRIQDNDELSKLGDDYCARIYVVVDGGLLRWRSKALNYVWSGQAEAEATWPNAFLPKNAMMLATRTVNDPLDTWLSEKRNVREDLQKVYGKDFTHIDVVALMTDTDNTGQHVSAFYGDIHFTAD